jgi:hypothetical protein
MSLARKLARITPLPLQFALARRLPTCRALVPVMSQSLERPLTLRERVVLGLHLFVCEFCENYLRHLHELRDAARGLGDRPGPGLTEEARERIRRALREQ